MSEKQPAVINISKILKDVSLPTIAAIGSATGNIWIAGAAAVPAAIAASDTLKSLLQKKQEEHLELSAPPWWTKSGQSWQITCASIENGLPAAMNSMAERLRKEGTIPTTVVVRRVFAEELNRELARHLSTWEVTAQNREMVAEYVTPPLLQKSATVLKTVIDPIREDAFAKELEKISDALVQTSIEKPQPAEASAPGIATAVAPTSVAPSPAPSIDDILKQKAQNDAYDVYICYHDEDEDEVFKIGEQLKARGILPWFDILARAGKLRRRQQEEQIEKIPAAAVFVGQHAVADWQALQMYSFLEQFVERECAVIPVLLPDAPQKPKLPVFLANFGWVDFRKKVPEPMGQLIWGITGERPQV